MLAVIQYILCTISIRTNMANSEAIALLNQLYITLYDAECSYALCYVAHK